MDPILIEQIGVAAGMGLIGAVVFAAIGLVQNVFTIFAEPRWMRSRDECESMWRSVHSCARKPQREAIARLRPNP